MCQCVKDAVRKVATNGKRNKYGQKEHSNMIDKRQAFGPVPNYPNVEKYNKPIEKYIIGGPCFFESKGHVLIMFDRLPGHITHMRGGVFKAGTYPSDSFGLDMEMLKYVHSKSKEFSIPNIVDVLDIRDLDKMYDYAGVFQVGARQSQHYALLKELGKQKKPVILKRGTNMTFNEFIGSAEYILKGGNSKLTLCERGSVSFLDHTRWELSISMIAKVKEYLNIPIIVDASHATGDYRLVNRMTMAGMAAGADGFIAECHQIPRNSISDSEQALSIESFIKLSRDVKSLWGAKDFQSKYESYISGENE